jgi:Tfp pilus assembly protein PilV
MNRLIAQNAGSEGFSLLELIVAFFVLALAMGAALQTIGTASRGIAIAREKRAVIQLVEELRATKLPLAISNGRFTDEGLHEGMRWQITFAPAAEVSLRERQVQGLATIRIYPAAGGSRYQNFVVFASGLAS